MSRLTIPEVELLQYALIGYEARRAEIEAAMRTIRDRIEPSAKHRAPAKEAARRRRRLSPEGRAAIIAGVKKRWAKVRQLKRKERAD